MLPRNGGADLLPRGPFAKPVLASARAAGRARRQPPAVSQPSGQGPVLVGIASAVPDLQLGAWSGRPVRVVETLPGLRIVKGAIGLRDKDLRGRVVGQSGPSPWGGACGKTMTMSNTPRLRPFFNDTGSSEIHWLSLHRRRRS